jgi:hypothetical protein
MPNALVRTGPCAQINAARRLQLEKQELWFWFEGTHPLPFQNRQL